MWEQDLKMTRRIKEEIIHFQHPETEHPSVLRSFVCRYYWIGLVVICQGCYYQGCGDFETFGFSPGKALSLSGSSQFDPVQTQNGPKAGHSSTVSPSSAKEHPDVPSQNSENTHVSVPHL